MRKKGLLLFALAAVALCFGGCQNTVNTVENADKSATPDVITDKRFITDGFLKNRLALRSVYMSPAASGNLMVQVSATNVRTGFFAQMWSGFTGDNPYRVDYKFTWQDENGMVVDTPLSAWRTVSIHPGETVQFVAVAPSLRCKDFLLNVKESE